MRIRAERDDLADVLSRAARAVSARSPLPILQGLLIVVKGRTLHVTGTDLDVTVRTQLEAEVLEEGRTVVPARLITEAVRKLPPGAVVLEASGGEVQLTGGGPRFRFREMATDDFPAVAEAALQGALEVDGDDFIQAVGQVMVAASHDDARPVLTGVFFESHEGALRLVATDSYRLALRDIPAVRSTLAALIPARALRELHRTIATKKLLVAVGGRDASFGSDRGTLTVRLIEGTFPNYHQLLPAEYPSHLTVGREALLDAIGRASLVAEDHIPVRLQLQSGGVELSVTRQDVGGETEHVSGEYQGEDMTIAFNSRYLNDGVAAVDDDEVVLDVIDPLKPGVLRGADSREFLYLLMPVRL
ncbi:MAG: DNA polymerase III subunit beta [Acidimicrobiia bacterium]|nr:DNA polymerase III subunit beta [Acidimicrobiia bacterium]